MESKTVFMVDRTTVVDAHALTKIHIYVVRMYVLVKVRDYSVHVQYGINKWP